MNTHDIKEKKKQWKRHVKHVESNLKDIQTTIRVVEKNREQFLQSISQDELHNRKVFVHDMHERVSKMKHEIISDSIRQKILQDERACTARRLAASNTPNGTSKSSVNNRLSNEEEAMIIDKHAQAQILLEQQDETLDDLDDAVGRVGVMAGAIHEEIRSQNKMLTDLEDDLTDAEEKLGLVMGKLAKLLKTKSKCQLGTIMVLSVTVVILFFLVLYT